MDYKKMAAAFAAGGAVLAAGAAYTMKQKNNNRQPNVHFSSGGGRKVYLSDTSLASLAVAAYLIRDYNFDGENIHIFQKENFMGGGCSLGVEDGALLSSNLLLHEQGCPDFFELFRSIPALSAGGVSVKKEIVQFYQAHPMKPMLILHASDGTERVLSKKDHRLLERLILTSENKLEKVSIYQWFDENTNFFQSDFWMRLRTLFGLKESSSAASLRQILLWRNDELKSLSTMKGWMSLPAHPAYSLIKPLYSYLKGYGVHFYKGAEIEDVLFSDTYNLRARMIVVNDGKKRRQIELNGDDLCVCVLGSSFSDACFGSLNKPCGECSKQEGLWNRLASHRSELNVPGQLLEPKNGAEGSFVFTFKEGILYQYLSEYMGNLNEREGLICLADTNWGITLDIHSSSSFPGQAGGVMSGTIVYPYEQGDHIRKTFDSCSGEEILEEILQHLGCTELKTVIQKDCIKATSCLMPNAYAAKLAENEAVLHSPKLNDSNFAVLSPYRKTKSCCWLEHQVTQARTVVTSLMQTVQEGRVQKAKNLKQQTVALRFLRQVS